MTGEFRRLALDRGLDERVLEIGNVGLTDHWPFAGAAIWIGAVSLRPATIAVATIDTVIVHGIHSSNSLQRGSIRHRNETLLHTSKKCNDTPPLGFAPTLSTAADGREEQLGPRPRTPRRLARWLQSRA